MNKNKISKEYENSKIQIEEATRFLYEIGSIDYYIEDNQIKKGQSKCCRIKQPYASIVFFFVLAMFYIIIYFAFRITIKYGGVLLTYITEQTFDIIGS